MTTIPSSTSISNGRGRRNWAPETYAEVFIRLNDHGQSVHHVARMTGLTLMQVAHFRDQLHKSPDQMPQNLRFPTTEQFDEVRQRLAREVPTEFIRGRGRPKLEVTPELLAEVEGCVALARQVPNISAVRFLQLCINHARKA